jgi:hypothetical protein
MLLKKIWVMISNFAPLIIYGELSKYRNEYVPSFPHTLIPLEKNKLIIP